MAETQQKAQQFGRNSRPSKLSSDYIIFIVFLMMDISAIPPIINKDNVYFPEEGGHSLIQSSCR